MIRIKYESVLNTSNCVLVIFQLVGSYLRVECSYKLVNFQYSFLMLVEWQ